MRGAPTPRKSALLPLSGAAGLAMVVGVCAVFLLATDGLILAFSPFPRLYGIINALSCHFEETLLYLPVVKKFSFLDPFLADFTGPGVIHGLAPFPYLSFASAKVLSMPAGGSLNGIMFLMHAVLLANVAMVFLFIQTYTERGDISFGASLLTLFGYALLTFKLALMTHYHSPLFWTAVCLLFGIFSLLAWFASRASVLLAWGAMLPLAAVAAFVIDAMWPSLTGAPLAMEQYATRFLSPSLPFCYFFLTMWVMVRCEGRLQAGRGAGAWWLAAAVCFVANFYVYFANWLVLAPPYLAWLGLRHRQIRAERSWTVPAALVAAALSLPFLRTLTLSKTDTVYRDFVERSGQFSVALYHRFNYPPLFALLGSLVIVGAFVVMMRRGARRSGQALKFTDLLPLATYTSSVLLAYGNYLLPRSIPQALLLHRYWIPLIVVSACAAYRVNRNSAPRLAVVMGQRPVFVACAWLSVSLAAFAFGQWNLHERYSGPSMEPLAKTAEGVAQLAAPDDVLVSDWQALNLFAPSLGLKTLVPDPVITLASNDRLLAPYMLLNKILGRSPAQFFYFLGDLDLYGEVHEQNKEVPPTAMLLSQTRGLAYPMPSTWLETNKERLLHEYEMLDLDDALRPYSALLMCLQGAKVPPLLLAKTRLVGRAEQLDCWRWSKG